MQILSLYKTKLGAHIQSVFKYVHKYFVFISRKACKSQESRSSLFSGLIFLYHIFFRNTRLLA